MRYLFTGSINAKHAEEHPWHDELKARMNNDELAFRMQMQVPEVIDLQKEDAKTKEAYGISKDATDALGRKCLLARKLVEKGVRFVQLYAGTWDSHDYIERAHGNLISQVDQPIAALIADPEQRGRSAYDCDHNPKAMTIWMAGGGCKAGRTIGATDDRGMEVIEDVHHVRDLQVTLLRLLGLDDNKLTLYHGGRFK